MTLAVAAGYTVCVATIALIRLSSVAHLLAVARSGTRQTLRRKPSGRARFFSRNDGR